MQIFGQILRWAVRLLRQTLRIFLRPLAIVCLLIASVALASDMTKTATSSGVRLTPVEDHWRALAPQSLANAQGFIQRSTHKLVWSAAVSPLLQVPTWVFFGAVGLLAVLVTRRRREVNIYVN
jgi:hypothetical protein